MAIGVVAALASCTSKQQPAVMDFTFQTDSVHWSDSVMVGAMPSTVTIDVAAPAESSQAYQAITKWITTELNAPEKMRDMSMSKLVPEIGKMHLDSIRMELEEYAKKSHETPMPYEYDWHIAPLHFTNQFVTYADTCYQYSGGAHGSTVFSAASFTLADSKEWGYNMFAPSKIGDLKQMVVKALAKQYFEAATEEDFAQMLLVPVDSVPLPTCPPYITDKGIAFTYQQYEIAPYSAGMPWCVLSFFDVHNLISKEFAEHNIGE